MVADVVVVVDVVGESDINGPDSLAFGAADASAVTPMITIPAIQPVATSLSIMIHTLFHTRTCGAPTPCVRMASAIGFNGAQSPTTTINDFIWTTANRPRRADPFVGVGDDRPLRRRQLIGSVYAPQYLGVWSERCKTRR